MDDLMELDHRVFGKMPPALLEGAHLAGLYPATHPSVRLREMEAFRLLKAHPEMTLSARSALALYDAMTAGTICEGWGFRTCNCYVKHGDFLYIAPSGEQAPRLAEDLFHRYQELNDPGRVQIEGIFHFLFEFICIHPMAEGNGRLSAFLVQLLLQRAGFSCAPYLPYDFIQNRRYYSRFQQHIQTLSGVYYGQKQGDLAPFVRLCENFVELALRLLEETCDGMVPAEQPRAYATGR